MTADVELLPCGECGMPCRAGEYHPFAACLMFKACHNSETVRANMEPLQAENERLRAEVERLRLRDAQINDLLNRALVDRKKAEARAGRLAEALREARAESDRWRDRYRAAIDQARGKGLVPEPPAKEVPDA